MLDSADIKDVLLQKLMQGKAVRFPAQGSSMGSYYEAVDYFVVKPLAGRPAPGRLLLIQKEEGGWFIHRLILGCGNQLLTLGDGNQNFDRWSPLEKVLGVVSACSRDGKEMPENRGAATLRRSRMLLRAHALLLYSRLRSGVSHNTQK